MGKGENAAFQKEKMLLFLIMLFFPGLLKVGIVWYGINPLPDDKFKTSKLKEFADDNFKFDENGRKLSKRVENTMGKGEIARYKQFLLFPQCFQKACFPGASKGVIVWEWVKRSTIRISLCLPLQADINTNFSLLILIFCICINFVICWCLEKSFVIR